MPWHFFGKHIKNGRLKKRLFPEKDDLPKQSGQKVRVIFRYSLTERFAGIIPFLTNIINLEGFTRSVSFA